MFLASSSSLLRRWALVLRKTWTLTDTRWLLATVAVLLAFGIAESAFTLSHPCLLSSEIYSESCRPQLILLMVITWIKVLSAAVPLNILHGPISSAAMAIQLGQKSDSGARKQAMARSWAPASSREVFYDLTKVRQYSAPYCVRATVELASLERMMPVADIHILRMSGRPCYAGCMYVCVCWGDHGIHGRIPMVHEGTGLTRRLPLHLLRHR